MRELLPLKTQLDFAVLRTIFRLARIKFLLLEVKIRALDESVGYSAIKHLYQQDSS